MWRKSLCSTRISKILFLYLAHDDLFTISALNHIQSAKLTIMETQPFIFWIELAYSGQMILCRVRETLRNVPLFN